MGGSRIRDQLPAGRRPAGACQHRVLLAGVAGALALRGGFIAAGVALLDHLSWAFYAFGAFPLVAW